MIAVLAAACTAPPPPASRARASDPCDPQVAIAALLEPTPTGRVDIDVVAARAVHLVSCPKLPVNLRRFVAAVSRQADDAFKFGFSVSDRAYVERSRRATALPSLLRSQRFLRLMQHPRGYADAVHMIDEANAGRPNAQRWSTVLYESQFLRSADQGTYGRLLVHVPGPITQWIQYGIVTPTMKPETPMHSISVVAIERGQAYWMDYWRTYRDGRIELPARVVAGHGNVNCYNCHKLPVVPIHPKVEYSLNERGALVVARRGAGPTLLRLNGEIRGYGPAAFAGLLDPDSYGPALGDPDRARSAAFWRRCTEPYGLNAAARARVERAMACANCHDGSAVSRINYPQALHTDQDDDILLHPDTRRSMALVPAYVRAGWMPPRSKLRPGNEREALINCLMLDYFDPTTRRGALVDWLRSN